MDIAAFYDRFADRQLRAGENERHRFLLRQARRFGLGPRSSVLELGCGVGVITARLARLTRGRIVAVDLSPRSVEMARARAGPGHAKLDFVVADAASYDPCGQTFDFVLLFDILEHVPLDQHDRLLAMVSGAMTEGSQLLLNLPNPPALRHAKEREPESCQVVDLPLELDYLAGALKRAGLRVHSFQTYGLWWRDDYQFFRILKDRDYSPSPPRRTPRLARLLEALRGGASYAE